MKIINPRVEQPNDNVPLLPAKYLYSLVEAAGRTCYLSERVEGDTTEAFIKRLMERKHWSVLEHASISLRFICDRGVTHELVRHRLASYSQESTRYCNYSKGKFGNEITVIEPCFWEENSPEYQMWKKACEFSETMYMDLLNEGATPQQARSVLPNSLKTEIVVTMNVREWRHFLEMRLVGIAGAPHPQMVELAKLAYDILVDHYPLFFENIKKAQ